MATSSSTCPLLLERAKKGGRTQTSDIAADHFVHRSGDAMLGSTCVVGAAAAAAAAPQTIFRYTDKLPLLVERACEYALPLAAVGREQWRRMVAK